MSNLILLARAQMRRIEPFFPRSRGLARVDDQRGISGISIFAALAAVDGVPDRLMIDATHLKAHRTAASLLQKGALVISAAPRVA